MAKKPPAPEPPNGRERLIEAAIRLFGRDGFAATSLRAIADEAGVSWGLVRFYFGSKDGLRDAAEERVVRYYLDIQANALRIGSHEELVEVIAATSGELAEVAPFLRRAIIEDRPIALDFIRRLIEGQRPYTKRVQESFPGEAWAEDPMRALVWRLGHLLLAPQIETLLGRKVYSPEELERRNRDVARMDELMTLGLEAERKSGKKR